MARLARPTSDLRPSYDAVVVGSGYGGGVAACRLARMGLSVAVLERGREFAPGEFPATTAALRDEISWIDGGRRAGARDGLFALHVGGDAGVLAGCGLGGGSLIGAGITVNPDMLLLEDEVWPLALRTDHYLSLGFERARRMLAPRIVPGRMRPGHLASLEAAAAAFERVVERLPAHIAFEATAPAGMTPQPACTACGQCLTGCNVGAMTTVRSSYLALAAAAGAELFTGAAVRFVEPVAGKGWRVVLRAAADTSRAVPLKAVAASIVVLAAGTLGTADVLMRSRERGLALSDRLGCKVSVNLDLLAVGTVSRRPAGRARMRAAPAAGPDGPAVAGMIDLRRRRDPMERVTVCSVGLPEAVAELLAPLLAAPAAAAAPAPGGDSEGPLARARRKLADRQAVGAAASRDLIAVLAHGLDAAAGEITRHGDGVRLVWPAIDDEPATVRAQALLHGFLAGAGAQPARDLLRRALGIGALAIDPVGGAAMADDRAHGVVDHRCRVLDGDPRRAPDAVHPGLYVVDASVMPRPLGIHPLLTIAAVAERAMLLLARDLGLPAEAAARAGAAGSPAEGAAGAPAAAPSKQGA